MHDNSRNVVELINNKNEIFKNNIMNINFNVENAVVVVKIENKTLRNIALKQNFRNKHIKEDVSDENTKFLIE